MKIKVVRNKILLSGNVELRLCVGLAWFYNILFIYSGDSLVVTCWAVNLEVPGSIPVLGSGHV